MSPRLFPPINRGKARRALARLTALSCFLLTASAARADRLALWTIVHDRCVANLDAGRGPAPCASVDESQGVAILKDIVGVAQFLAIPTRRITGIESPDILTPDAPPVWSEAWKAHTLLNARLGVELPRGAIAIAVNSSLARSQDQLHLHVDCLARDAAAALADYRQLLSEDWHALPFKLAGRRYWARRVNSTDLSNVTPFRLLADGLPDARANMSMQTLVAVGADFASQYPGFILLADQGGIDGGGHGEDLQDHSCAIRAQP